MRARLSISDDVDWRAVAEENRAAAALIKPEFNTELELCSTCFAYLQPGEGLVSWDYRRSLRRVNCVR